MAAVATLASEGINAEGIRRILALQDELRTLRAEHAAPRRHERADPPADTRA
ncbi:MAG TPA: hypothetical protein VF916_05450 [Ktedonobacterales bacterium]